MNMLTYILLVYLIALLAFGMCRSLASDRNTETILKIDKVTNSDGSYYYNAETKNGSFTEMTEAELDCFIITVLDPLANI